MKTLLGRVVVDVIVFMVLGLTVLGITFGITVRNNFNKSLRDERNWAVTTYRDQTTYRYVLNKDELLEGAVKDSAVYFENLAMDALSIY